MFGYFDTHIHLFAPEWQLSPEEIHRQAQAGGIGQMLMPGVRVADWPQLLDLARQLAGVYFAPGLHPVYADQWNGASQEQLVRLMSEPEVVAVGEIGLDALAGPDLDSQEKVFRVQLQIAIDAGVPVLLHSRKTTGRVIQILRELKVGQKVGGVWHGFSGSLQIAQELVGLGFKIGVGPILLRESARKLPQAVGVLNPEDLLLETDAPDMIEGPMGLIDVAKKISELKDWSLVQTAQLTSKNASHLFLKAIG